MLVVLTLGAVFMGLAASIGDLVGERAIYLRERWVGLSPTAYLIAKLGVLGALVFLQCTVLVALTLLLRNGPKGAVLLGAPGVELVLALWLCALACVALGLLVSAAVATTEQMMPLLVMRREHGELWRRMDSLERSIAASTGGEDVETACQEMLALLENHNAKEEPIIYPHLDADLDSDERARVRELFRSGTLPEGWVCQA